MTTTTFDDFIIPPKLADKICSLKKLATAAKIMLMKSKQPSRKGINLVCFKNDIYYNDYSSMNKAHLATGIKANVIRYYVTIEKPYIDENNNKWLFINVDKEGKNE